MSRHALEPGAAAFTLCNIPTSLLGKEPFQRDTGGTLAKPITCPKCRQAIQRRPRLFNALIAELRADGLECPDPSSYQLKPRELTPAQREAMVRRLRAKRLAAAETDGAVFGMGGGPRDDGPLFATPVDELGPEPLPFELSRDDGSSPSVPADEPPAEPEPPHPLTLAIKRARAEERDREQAEREARRLEVAEGPERARARRVAEGEQAAERRRLRARELRRHRSPSP